MSELKINGWTVEVETSYAGGKRYETRVDIFTLGPRGGRRPLRVPRSPEGLKDFALAMSLVAVRVAAEEERQMEQARVNGVLSDE